MDGDFKIPEGVRKKICEKNGEAYVPKTFNVESLEAKILTLQINRHNEEVDKDFFKELDRENELYIKRQKKIIKDNLNKKREQ